MLKLGITGGIGSGKTSICKIFEVLGIPIYYSDDRAKAIMVQNEVLIAKVKSLFGNDAYFEDGSLNRQLIGSIVFNDREKLNALNKIVHPIVHQEVVSWNESLDSPYSLRESAILIESGGIKAIDQLILVYTPQDMRIDRVMKRDQVSRQTVKDRISKQLSDSEKIKYADYIIFNDGKSSLIDQVLYIHRKILNY